jgi:hypothetical protein
VSWWPAEGDATDIVGTNSGILQNGMGFDTGEVGQAFSFDGVSSYIVVPASASLDVGAGSGFTLECWINPADLANEHALAEWNDAAGNIGVHLWISIAQLGGLGSIYANLKDPSGGDHNFASPPNLLTTGNYQHVALTYDKGSGIARIYYNGAAVAAQTVGVFTPQTSYALYFGTRISGYSGVGGYYSGLMDEVSLYNRALQDSEIQAIFNAGTLGKCKMAPPYIVAEPPDQSVAVGGTAVFSVGATGISLAYQWHFNTDDITGATNATLVLSNVQTNQAGQYSVTLTNIYGSTNSSAGVLSISPQCVSAAPGMISWWPAEGDATDPFGGNNGVVEGTMAFAAGESGQAFNFIGTNGDIRVPASLTLDLGASDGLTVECWINPTNVTTGHAIAEFNNGTGGVGMHFWHSDPGIGGPGALFANVMDTSGSSHLFASAANLITTNSFQHVALTYSKTNGVAKLYRNGVVVASQNFGSLRPQTTYDLYLGKRASGSGTPSFFTGLMDEIAVYNRALSDAEIQSTFLASTNGKTCLPPQILTQPQGFRVKPGTNVTFTALSRGTPPLSYQWRLNTTILAGATNSSLIISNVQPSDAGNYSLKITNALGSTVSSNAQLKVDVVFAFGNGQPLTNSQAYFGGPVTVQLQNVYTNGDIFYTLDGSVPTFNSTLYSGPFLVTHDTVLQALGYSANFFQSGQLDPVAILLVPTYSLAATTAGGGTITLSPSGGSYLSNTVVNLTASPTSGWSFLQWLGDIAGTNPLSTVTMKQNKSVRAVFGTSLSTTAAGGGSVALNPYSSVYPYGQVVKISAIPDPGNYFGLWGNSASSNINPLLFVVTNANPTVSALFGAVDSGDAALTVVPIGNGQIAVSPRNNIYTTGQGVSISATPDPGQSFLGWSGDASGTQNPLALLMGQSKTIYANFTHRASLSVKGVSEGLKPEGFVMTLTGDFGARYQIVSSTNLANWLQVLTVTNSYGTSQLTDTGAISSKRLFYRALLLP